MLNAREGTSRSTIQLVAIAIGAVFIAVGILGFIPGITTNYSRLSNFGGTGAKLLGIFGINWLENAVHLLFGVAGLTFAKSFAGSRAYFVGGGIIYVVVWIYGIAIDLSSSANIIGVNSAANWLHFVLGIVMLGVGLVLGRAATAGGTSPLRDMA